jgi:hypothetical protein
MADGLGQRLTLQVEVDHHLPPRRKPALGAVDVGRIVAVVENVLEGKLRFFLAHA